MFSQQWSGIDSIIYYAPIIFQSLNLTGRTSSPLVIGVVGCIDVAFDVPPILIIGKIGRKPLTLCGSLGMLVSQVIIGVIVATCSSQAAGWAAVLMIFLETCELDLDR
ncbi:hypothetical protein E4T43_02053 [Aureobasidium subglaciale]|nr:hypothetical protein E4T43_02053 [Aureobasidium subglaciale]